MSRKVLSLIVFLVLLLGYGCNGRDTATPVPTTEEEEVTLIPEVTRTPLATITLTPLPPTFTATPSNTPAPDCGSYNYNVVKRTTIKVLSTENGKWVTTLMHFPTGDESGITDSEGVWYFVRRGTDGKWYVLIVRNMTGKEAQEDGNTILKGLFDAKTSTSKIARWEGKKAYPLKLQNLEYFGIANPCSGNLVDAVFILTQFRDANNLDGEIVIWVIGDWDGKAITVKSFGQAPK